MVRTYGVYSSKVMQKSIRRGKHGRVDPNLGTVAIVLFALDTRWPDLHTFNVASLPMNISSMPF